MAKVENIDSETNPFTKESKEENIEDHILLGKAKPEETSNTSLIFEESRKSRTRNRKNNFVYDVLKQTDNELKRVE